MSKEIKELVENINESESFVRLLEVGAGVPTANLIYQYSNASKTIYSSESYYAREAFDEQFGKANNRAVSAERLHLILNSEQIESDILDGKYNTIFASTFQVWEHNEDNKSTHGWIAVDFAEAEEDDAEDWINHNTKYYHISIHKPLSRQEYIRLIGEIGIKILACRNEYVPSDCYIDIILDDIHTPIYNESLEAIVNCEETEQMTVFKEDGTIDRIESILRGTDRLVVYKGSFNPPTIAHEMIVKQCVEEDGNTKVVFCISVDTYEKGQSDIESLRKRINFIHALGYDVLICHHGYFINNLNFIRQKYQGNVVFPMGVDTINRLAKFYHKKVFNGSIADIENPSDENYSSVFLKRNFEENFSNCEIICFSRDGEEVDKLLDSQLVTHKVQKYGMVSSSDVRELFANGHDKSAIEMIPHPIRHYVLREYSIVDNEN